MAAYKRVVLKRSGEALAGGQGFGIDAETVQQIALQIKSAYETGVEIAIIVGGGNIWRGKTASEMGMERSSADYMGMLATAMNGLALQDALEARKIDSRVQTAIQMREIAEPFIQRKAEGPGDEQIHFAPKMVYPLYEADSQTVQAVAGLS